MKASHILCAAALCLATTASAAEGIHPRAPEVSFEVTQQILAELKLAPSEMLGVFASDEAKLKDFIAGRLHDMAMADFAAQHGLDKDPAIVARRIVSERSELVRAAVVYFQEGERAKLPDLEPLAKQRYLATRQQFATPEQVRIAHILLRADVEVDSEEEIAKQKAKALQVKGRLAAGEDFAALARSFSQEPATAENGGELPRLANKGSFVPPFDRAAWALGEGEVSDVVRTRFGFHIIKLLERKPASYKPFEEVRNELIQAVQDEILAPKRSAFVDSFRGKAVDAKAALILPEVQDAVKALHARAIEQKSPPTTSSVPVE